MTQNLKGLRQFLKPSVDPHHNFILTKMIDNPAIMMEKRFFILSALIIVFIIPRSFAQKRQLIQWEFYKGDVGSLYEIWRSDELSKLPAWEKVTIPHSYNAFDAVDPDISYYQGPAWYRIYIDIDQLPERHRVILHFEGAGQKTEVYIHNQYIGKHIGGYNEFTFDITDVVSELTDKFPYRIPLAVKTDNSRDVNLIPSNLSDFTLYGGIYRKVWMEFVPDNYIRSVFIHPALNAERNIAKVSVDLSLTLSDNDKAIPANGNESQVSLEVVTAENITILKQSRSLKLQHEKLPGCFEFDIKNPDLWSTTEPELYTCILALQTKSGRHEIRKKFGIRNFEFIENGPLILNGSRLFLRGTHRHEDHAGYGAAMPDELIRKEMMMIKDMGANFIRLGHYQQSELVLELCDSLGILVWEEIPWCRGGVGYEDYRELAHSMLKDMIEQHYNHPSIILWGLGNEQDWPGDFDWYSEDSVRNLMASLNALAHQLDKERKTCIRRCDFASDIVDVYSPSIWAGWYRGKYTDIMQVSKEWNQKVPRFFHAEWGASHHPYRHSNYPDNGLENIPAGETDERTGDFLPEGGEPRISRDGDWSVTYACNLIDWHLKEFENMPWHTGAAYWAFKDFSTPLRPDNPIPYVNQKGVVQRDLTPKESYYIFQSYWTTKPMIKIYGHTWLRRHGDADADNLIKVYSNVARVEVILNGESLGIRKRNTQDFPAAGLRWLARYQHGENTVIAISREKGIVASDTLTFYYQTEKWDKPDRLEFYKHEVKGETATVYLRAVDINGIPCLDNKEFVKFSIAGPGRLMDDLGTMGGSRKIQLANGQAFIKVQLNNGDNTIAASSDNLKTGFVLIDNNNPDVFSLAEIKSNVMIDLLDDRGLLPRSEDHSGGLRKVEPGDWTSGFFPGILWFIYQETNNENWQNNARQYTAYLRDQQFNNGTHDMGFKMFCSYGNGHKLTKDTSYRTILIQSAYTLASRFSPVTGCIKSWDWGTDRWEFPVIIDNMMNLELLFQAYHETKDTLFYSIAVSHADKTIENHFRDDNSSFHVVDYDPKTGQVIKKLTHQGYSSSSSWARGQAWGLYGFTMCYRETGLSRYLDMAEKIAGFIIHHPNLPEDKIPYWDFNDPDIPGAPRDVSAATIICSALYELASFSENHSQRYLDVADSIFHSLWAEKYAIFDKQSPFILKHSTGNKPAGDEIDVPIIYADYYFLEAAIRRNNIDQ